MLMKPDGTARQAWALQDRETDEIHLFSVCESEELVDALLRARRIHQAHLPDCRVVSVTVRLTLEAR